MGYFYFVILIQLYFDDFINFTNPICVFLLQSLLFSRVYLYFWYQSSHFSLFHYFLFFSMISMLFVLCLRLKMCILMNADCIFLILDWFSVNYRHFINQCIFMTDIWWGCLIFSYQHVLNFPYFNDAKEFRLMVNWSEHFESGTNMILKI